MNQNLGIGGTFRDRFGVRILLKIFRIQDEALVRIVSYARPVRER